MVDSELDDEEQEARDAAGLGAADDEDAGGGGGDQEVLKVQDVDAYWLQRSISKAYDGSIDAPKAQALAEEVFEILQVGGRSLKQQCVRACVLDRPCWARDCWRYQRLPNALLCA